MSDFKSREQIMKILQSAFDMLEYAKKNTSPVQDCAQYKALLAFLEPSTRTHLSFQQAARNLGMRVTDINGEAHTSRQKQESLADTFRTLIGQGSRVLVLRSGVEGAPRYIAQKAQRYISNTSIINEGPVSVINGGDGRNQHPTQTILDLLTIWKTLGRLDNFTIGITNDLLHGRTGHSLMQALSLFDNVKIVLTSPKGLEMPERYKHGLDIICESNDVNDLGQCDIVYVTRFQDERIDNPELKRSVELERQKFIINKELLDSWSPNIRIMHPLPKVWEISPGLSEDPRLIAFQQAEYGILARMALLLIVCDNENYQPIPLDYDRPDLILNTISREVNVKRPKHFKPVEQGTTIDHIPEGKASVVIKILRAMNALEEGQTWLSVHSVPSTKLGGRKDELLLHNHQIPELVAATIQTIFPQTTFNSIQGNGTLVKTTYNSPVYLDGLYCQNKNCVTNIEFEATPRFLFCGNGHVNRELICEFCETPLWY